MEDRVRDLNPWFDRRIAARYGVAAISPELAADVAIFGSLGFARVDDTIYVRLLCSGTGNNNASKRRGLT